MLVILSGASGSGKNTIINRLLSQYKNMEFFKNATTRPMRPGEEHMYYYLSNEEFEQKIKNDELVEHQNVHGFYYGVLKSEIQKVIDNPDKIYIRDIEVYGSQSVKEYIKTQAQVLLIYLDAPDDVLMNRLLARGESEERAKIRLSRAANERTFKPKYDYCIDNINLDDTVSKIKKCIDDFIKKNK